MPCERNYPKYGDAPKADIPNILTEEMIAKMHDKSYALHLVNIFSQYLNEFAAHYPCEQLMAIENLYRVCFEIAYTEEIPLELQLYDE